LLLEGGNFLPGKSCAPGRSSLFPMFLDDVSLVFELSA